MKWCMRWCVSGLGQKPTGARIRIECYSPQRTSRMSTMTYLLYCFFVSSIDLTCFKKLGVETADGQISVRQELWIERMHSLMPSFTQATCTWAGYKNGTSAVTPYWDGETHPTVFGIPHLAAQDIVERVPCLCFITDI